MPDTGYVLCGTGEHVADVFVDWIAPGNITNETTLSYASSNSLSSGDVTDVLRGVNYDLTSITAGSIINGVEIRVADYFADQIGATGIWSGTRLNMPDDSASASTSTVQFASITNSEQTDEAGDSTELWGETISYSDTQDVDFGGRVATKNGVSTCAHSIGSMYLRVYYTADAVTATGTITGADEQDITDGDILIYLDLTAVTWATAGATFDAQRQGIIDGIDSAQTETLGWNNEVRDTMTVARCVRTSDTRVTITLNATECADYKITADEVLTATIPASAHSGSTILTDANFATVTALCDQTLAPTVLDTQTNLTGAVTDIDEFVDSPDSNWLTLNYVPF